MALDEFRRSIVENVDIQSRIVDNLVSMIDAERSGYVVDQAVIATIIKMFITLQVNGIFLILIFLEHFCRCMIKCSSGVFWTPPKHITKLRHS
jgi:hypothetical protein